MADHRQGDVAVVEGKVAVYMPTRWEWLDGSWTAIPLSVGPTLGNVYALAAQVQAAEPQGGGLTEVLEAYTLWLFDRQSIEPRERWTAHVERFLADRPEFAVQVQGGGLTDDERAVVDGLCSCVNPAHGHGPLCPAPKVTALLAARAVPAETLADRLRADALREAADAWERAEPVTAGDERMAGWLRARAALLDPAEQPATREDGETT